MLTNFPKAERSKCSDMRFVIYLKGADESVISLPVPQISADHWRRDGGVTFPGSTLLRGGAFWAKREISVRLICD